MGHKKAVETTKIYLENAPLPAFGKTYTVVSHKEVMDHTQKLLKVNGFTINKQLFKSSMNARVAQGIYNITGAGALTDSELSMMFAWTNSYDKSTRFQCGIGAYVIVCNNGMIHGDMANYGRKHTGTANADIAVSIAQQISVASQNYNQLVSDKNDMKNIDLSIKDQSEFLGRLFIEEKLLDSQQMSCVKSEMDKASFNYGTEQDNAWSFYNHVTHSLKLTHPRDWMKKQAKFHEFMTAEVLSNSKPSMKDSYQNPEDDFELPEEFELDVDKKRENNPFDDYDSSNNVFTL